MMKIMLRAIGMVCVLLSLLGVGTFAYLFSFYNMPHAEYQADCIVVFGAAVWPDGNPSDALSDRVYEAIDIYKKSGPRCLVFSGADSVYGKHEVDVMLDIAYQEGVDLVDVELDYYGTNTKETILNLDMSRTYILVSSDFHLARIILLARQAGLSEYHVVGSTYRQGRYTSETFLIVREVGAFWYYLFVG